MKNLRELTDAEAQIMNHLWQVQKGSAREVMEAYGKNKPSINTVSTLIRILEQKGFVGHKPAGRSFTYFPKITREAYLQFVLSSTLKQWFDNSATSMISFMKSNGMLLADEAKSVRKMLKKEKKEHKEKADKASKK
jgi:predicted transcriptional regulator